MQYEVKILGSSSAVPTKNRQPSAQLIKLHNKNYLVDCGEGTQVQMRKLSIGLQTIDAVFISHLHADHFLGLPGLIATSSLLGRNKKLNIYAPIQLKEFIDVYFALGNGKGGFPIEWHPLKMDMPEILIETEKYKIVSFPLKHSIPCKGFLFQEKQHPRKLIKEKIVQLDLSIEQIKDLQAGKNISYNNKIVKNSSLTRNPVPSRSYAYCSDTMYDENILAHIKNVDVLYHEATFGQDKAERAQETYHSTAIQAATIAKKANAKRLLIGHFSARYRHPEILIEQAKTVFVATEGVEDGQTITISPM